MNKKGQATGAIARRLSLLAVVGVAPLASVSRARRGIHCGIGVEIKM